MLESMLGLSDLVSSILRVSSSLLLFFAFWLVVVVNGKVWDN